MTNDEHGGGITAPKQKRSRESFAQIRKTVLELLRERSSGQFSLAEVSARSGVSIGSIYGRVGSKAELIRVVQNEEFDRLDAATDKRLLAVRASGADLDGTARAAVAAFAAVLYDNASLLSPFFLLSAEDEVILERGAVSGVKARDAFCETLLDGARREGVVLDASVALWVYELVYSVCVRQLGLGGVGTTGPSPRIDTTEILGQLGDTVSLYLAAKRR